VTVELISYNCNIKYGSGKRTILPSVASVTFVEESLIKTYNGLEQKPTVLTVPEGLKIDYKFNGSTAIPIAVGPFHVVATVNDPNYIGSATANFVIQKATAIVSFNPAELTKKYTGVGMKPIATTDPEKLNVKYTFNGSQILPVIPGSYQVVATVDDSNYMGSISTMFNILAASATVTADNKVIRQGDPLPKYTATFSGFVNGEDASVVTSLSFLLSPAYAGKAGVYQIIPSAAAANYLFTPINGELYVNPFGAGVKNIKTSLTCVEPIPMDANGYTYIANFKYENPNSTPIYVSIGAENKVSGLGKFENSQQPVVFYPGTGTWQARFNGSKITWAVTTYNGTHKTSTASEASSSSNKCLKSATIQSNVFAENQGSEVLEPKAYPNPTYDKVYFDLGDRMIMEKGISVFDLAGRTIHPGIEIPGGNLIVVDFTGLDPGVYFVRLNFETEQKTIRIVKQ